MSQLFLNISASLFVNRRRVNEINGLGPSEHFLLLLVHLVHNHLGARMIWYLDMACMIERCGADMDWEFIISESKKLDFQDALYHILHMFKTDLAVEIPGEVLQKAKRRGGYSSGILKRMVSPANTLMDTFGGGKIWQFPKLSVRKLKTILLYGFLPVLLSDQARPWCTFNMGRKRKKYIVGELVSMVLLGMRFAGRRNLFKIISGGLITFLGTLISLPVHVYFNVRVLFQRDTIDLPMD